MNGRRYYVVLRRTVVQTQTVDFIASDFPADNARDMQKTVAAAYAAPERWVDERSEISIVDLTSEPITWKSDD